MKLSNLMLLVLGPFVAVLALGIIKFPPPEHRELLPRVVGCFRSETQDATLLQISRDGFLEANGSKVAVTTIHDNMGLGILPRRSVTIDPRTGGVIFGAVKPLIIGTNDDVTSLSLFVTHS